MDKEGSCLAGFLIGLLVGALLTFMSMDSYYSNKHNEMGATICSSGK